MKVDIVRFTGLDRWDVKYHTRRDAVWSGVDVIPFGDVARRRIEPVDRSLIQWEEIQLASIHFDGSISRRDSSRELKGKLFHAYPGDIVFSKIDARNGAIGVVPDELGRVAFTSEFPIYEVEFHGRLRAPFMRLLCRSQAFKDTVNSSVVGHSGRKRISLDMMEALKIPVPSTDYQDHVLQVYNEHMNLARELRSRADRLEATVSSTILGHLGVVPQALRTISRPFSVRMKDLDRWTLNKVKLVAQGITEEVLGYYPTRRLGEPDVAAVSYGVTKSPTNRPSLNARPYLRVANVQAGRLDLTEVKTIDVPPSQVHRFELLDGDLLLVEGNSEELVGRPAIWRGEIPGCVHQNHVIKVRVNRDLLDPEYVLAYMNTSPARLYFMGRVNRTTNLASINRTDVQEMPIPIPPLHVQTAIVREVKAIREDVQTLRTLADKQVNHAHKRAEAMINGRSATFNASVLD